MSDLDSVDPDSVLDVPTKKRKRVGPVEDELEIDVNLPEPPSKKALRKAKKIKSSKLEDPDAENAQSAPAAKSEPEAPAVAAYSVWIGNLPYTFTKQMLRKHLVTTSSTIPDESITRINLPAPRDAKASKTTLKPQNKGFAYVDFSTASAFAAALALSETQLAGRPLLIKDAKNFAGRPVKDDTEAGKKGLPATKKQSPTRKIFVGNLGFDVTKEDIEQHFAPCGKVDDVHMATFEDTGKCKGFAWVTFAATGAKSDGTEISGEEAAGAAVQGWIRVTSSPETAGKGSASESDGVEKKPKKATSRKWFVNRLKGRPLRCEFAEDPETRYHKRHGKDKETESSAKGTRQSSRREVQDFLGEVASVDVGPVRPQIKSRIPGIQPGAPTDLAKRRGRTNKPPPAQGTAYRTAQIVEATGQKTTFE